MKKRTSESASFVWISYSDLMTTLTLAFILIMLGLVAVMKAQAGRVSAVIKDITEARSSLIEGLKQVTHQMELDVEKNGCENVEWAVIEDRNAIRVTFRTGRGWFEEGDDELVPSGKNCLKYFSRLWLSTLYLNSQYRDQIEQLVVEGHTNSKPVRRILRGKGKFQTVEPYLGNLDLSQRRAFNAVGFILQNMHRDAFSSDDPLQPKWAEFILWQRKLLTATGRSSSEPVEDPVTKHEDSERSKRIEFKFILKHDYERYKKLAS